jgi:hypothetical protein
MGHADVSSVVIMRERATIQEYMKNDPGRCIVVGKKMVVGLSGLYATFVRRPNYDSWWELYVVPAIKDAQINNVIY